MGWAASHAFFELAMPRCKPGLNDIGKAADGADPRPSASH